MTLRRRLDSRDATLEAGRALGALLEEGDVVGLTGDLGAGKTTLTQGIAQGLGVVSPVTSPTYALIQEYMGRIPLFHADPYRLESSEALFGIGFEEYFLRGGVVIVEWADKIAELLPEDRLTISLRLVGASEFCDEVSREALFFAGGGRSRAILQTLAKQWNLEQENDA